MWFKNVLLKVTGEIDWESINKIVMMTMSRWPNQGEVTRTVAGGVVCRTAFGCPRSYTQCDATVANNEEGYVAPCNASSHVNMLDMVYAAAPIAINAPFTTLRAWNNTIELCIIAGALTINLGTNASSYEHMRCDFHEMQYFAALTRRLTEDWKFRQGWCDELVRPRDTRRILRRWTDVTDLALSRDVDQMGQLHRIMYRALGSNIVLSWTINQKTEMLKSRTGIRTSLGLWRNTINTSHVKLSMSLADLGYKMGNVRNHWTFGVWHLPGLQPRSDMEVDDRIMNIDWNHVNSSMVYETKPGQEEHSSGSYLITNFLTQQTLAIGAGWTIGEGTMASRLLGWGVKHKIRNWQNERMEFLTFSSATFTALSSLSTTAEFWTMAGTETPIFYAEEDTQLDELEEYSFPESENFSSSRTVPAIRGEEATKELAPRDVNTSGPEGLRKEENKTKAQHITPEIGEQVLKGVDTGVKPGGDPVRAEFSSDHVTPTEKQ